jgi:glycosyltransferase EpsH
VRRNPSVTAGAFTGRAKRNYLQRFKSYFTTYLYRRSMLVENNIRFPGTHSAEDSCFLICSLLCANRIASAETCYHYALQPGSVSQKRDPERWKNRLASFRHLEAFARANGLWRPYRCTLRWLVLKKGWALAGKDYLQNNVLSR